MKREEKHALVDLVHREGWVHSGCVEVEAPFSEGQVQLRADQGVGQAHRRGCVEVCGDLQDAVSYTHLTLPTILLV